nr:MAG TPA: protein of unknown function (DUF5047) [Caudoviricetes sp.]
MIDLATGGYTAEEVQKALHAAYGSRRIYYRYDRLDAHKVTLGALYAEDGSIKLDYNADIMRTGRFTIRDDPAVNWQAELLRPWFGLIMPDGGRAEWPLGLFYMPTAPKTGSRHVYREIEAYDTTTILWDDQVTSRYQIPKGSKYTAALSAIFASVGVFDAIIEPSESVTQTALEWEAGTAKGEIVQQLLTADNYEPLMADAWGRWRCRKYKDPRARRAEYNYTADELSVMLPDPTVDDDLFHLPNVFVGVVSRPDRPAMSFTYEITDPKSPLAAVNRGGRHVTETKIYEDAASAIALEADVRRRASQASSYFSSLKFSTAPMPHHAAGDVLWIEDGDIRGKYQEMKWSLDLQAGGEMKHEVQKEGML